MDGKEQLPRTAEPAGEDTSAGTDQDPDRERVIRETREAGMRAEGGGSADEEEIREAAGDGE